MEKRSFVPFHCCYSASRNEQLLCDIGCANAASEAWCLYDSITNSTGLDGSRNAKGFGVEFLQIPSE